jgi:two-component system, sensor histidine kinase and response regulator
MSDSEKTKEQLLGELQELRQRIAVTEQAEAESRRMEKALQEERNLLRTLIDLLPDYIYVKDTQGRFLVANAAVARIMRAASPSELLGKTDDEFYPRRLAIEYSGDERQVIETGEPLVNKDEAGVNPDGTRRAMLTTKVPLRDAQGQIVGLVGIGRDITERKFAEEELRRAHDELELRVRERTAQLAAANEGLEREHKALLDAKDAAEAASRAKSTFLANMSHEIRTPLNAVIGMTELVLKSQLSAQQREFLQTVRDSGEVLLSVINDILDFSKIEAGKLTLDFSALDLRESLGDTMKSFALRAHQQGLELACFIHPDVPHMVVGDYSRLRQIVVNLVGNAVKFTERGEVSLEVTRDTHSENGVALHFVVADTGIGIPREKQTAIFEMFEQADASTTRRHGGTGLGLAIASRLVGLMGGQMWVESEVGQGSRFHFVLHLDMADSEPAERPPPEPACLHGMRVLVIDDNATNRRILEECLRSWHMVPATAPGAADGVELLLQAQRQGEPFRLVLTDAHMPGVDGFTLAEQIKRDAAIGSTVVMMLTSGDQPDDMQRCEDLGISAYLLKPIKQSELLEAIQFALGITVAKKEAPPVEKGQAPPIPKLRVLLVEDSLVNQKLAVALLEGEGHTVIVANNGREACLKVESGRFDLILMDVQMPEMDGLEATVRIRAGEKQSKTHVPIIAMTAHALKGDRERCLEAGMDDYVSKPIRPDELFAAIGTLVTPRGQQAQATDTLHHEPGAVDWTEALRAVRGDYRLLRIIVELAVKEIPNQVAAIHEAVAGGNAAKLQLAAHTLKGAVRYFATSSGFEQVRSLEKMGQTKNLEGAEACLASLDAEVPPLLLGLEDFLRRTA